MTTWKSYQDDKAQLKKLQNKEQVTPLQKQRHLSQAETNTHQHQYVLLKAIRAQQKQQP